MKKLYIKLIAVVLELVLILSVVVMSSYAWLVLSKNPAAEGVQITIGGGNTILVAPDVAQEVDGTVYHYPGAFQDTLNISRQTGYEYLKDLGDLTPVSTADGLNWYLPAYYDVTDPEVQNGSVLSGTLKSIDEFQLDDMLTHANLSAGEEEAIQKGNYLYLDFWVVSPGSNYTLRVSTGEDGGSFVIGLMEAEESGSGYALVSAGDSAAASIRLGFLANPDDLLDNTMLYYQNSSGFSGQYTKLRGAYTEPGKGITYSMGYHFSIYEPNGDLHPDGSPVENGTYVPTDPIGLVDGEINRVDIRDRLSVQLQSKWLEGLENTTGTQIEQRFQTALLEPSFQDLTSQEATERFYSEYLGDQVAPYVSGGMFLKDTDDLYQATVNGAVEGKYLTEEYVAGATEDVSIVKLEKNIPQRIRLFIWLEGEDVDCVNSAEASSVAVRVELAGSTTED